MFLLYYNYIYIYKHKLKTIIMKTTIKHLETTINKLHVKHALAINEMVFMD